jgi:cobaltochelatase CobS
MAAHKSPEIHGVTLVGSTVWVDTSDGNFKLADANRSIVLSAGKHIGAFTGHGTPMGMTLETMRYLVETKALGIKADPAMVVRNEPTASASASPVVHAKPTAGNLDSAVAELVRTVLAGATVGVDPTELDELRNEIAVLRSLVETSAPTQIVLNNTPLKPITGVVHREFRKVLTMATQGQNVYLVGPAGSGKSTIPEQIAESLGMRFAAQSCGQTDAKFDYVGYRDGHGVIHGTLFRDMWENGGVFLLDELDNASPDMLVTLNQALANGQMAFPDGMVRRHENFMCFGAGNTFGNGATAQFVGRSPQDGAFINRFSKWVVDIDERVEDAMLASIGMDADALANWVKVVRACRANAERHKLRVMVTPRDAFRGAQLVATGEFTVREAVMSQFGFGLDENQFGKVTEGVTL